MKGLGLSLFRRFKMISEIIESNPAGEVMNLENWIRSTMSPTDIMMNAISPFKNVVTSLL